ncbi:MAG: tRNA pseudouridine(38-40) synthase TruA [Pseudomonadales bacterium]
MHLALGVEYDGAAFRGFQYQANAPSVQGALEAALSRIAAHPIRIAAAGRTDAGVHATGQVVSFGAPVERPLRAWTLGTNALTPAAVKVIWAQQVDADFHARYSALARRYQYLFVESDYPSPLLVGRATPVRELNDEAMHRAAQSLLGEQDFSSFRAAACQSRSAHRCVHRISVRRAGRFVVIDVTANAFLLHMVRNLAGALRQVGEGRRPEAWIGEVLGRRDRGLIGPTAAPDGLYLVGVRYADERIPGGQPPALLRALGGLDPF